MRFRGSTAARAGVAQEVGSKIWLAVAGFDDHDLNEHLCLDAACGRIAARSTIAQFADETAVVVTRYDRRPGVDGIIARVHQGDLCQALGVALSDKSQNEAPPAAWGSTPRRSSTAGGSWPGSSRRHSLTP